MLQVYMFSTFELSGLQQLLPLGADLLHAASHLSGGIMLSIQQLLARLLQSVNATLICRQLGFKSLVFLHLALQVGGIFVSLICGRLHLLVDPALELI